MTDLSTSLVMASVVVGLLTVPAASETINSSKTVSEDLPQISGSNGTAKEVVTTSGSDSISRKVETALKKFETSVSSDKASTSLETPTADFSVEQESDEKKWVLETSKGELEISRSPDSIVETVETPQGTLVKKSENGETTEKFNGKDREKVEEIRSELRSLMKQKKQELEERASKTRATHYSDSLELSINETAPEHVTIRNTGSSEINLTGWKLFNNNPESFELTASLETGQKLHVFTEDEKDLEIDEKEDDLYLYDSGLTWENTGDTATLKTPGGEEVVTRSY